MSPVRQLFAKFNGIQRLWVVSAIVWLLVVLVLEARTFPTESEWRSESIASAQRTRKLREVEAHEASMACVERLRKQAIACNESELNVRNNLLELGEIEYKGVLAGGERLIAEELQGEQLSRVGQAFALWFGPSVAVYVLGIGIAWVVRGFRGGA